MKKQVTKKERKQQDKIDTARVIGAGVIIFIVAVFLVTGIRTFTLSDANYIYELIEAN